MTDAQEYTYEGSQVLRNKFDIRDAGVLQRIERGVTAIRIQQLKEEPVRGDYGLQHMQDIHRAVFRDVYEWAGSVRTVDIAKGPATNRTVFALKEDIPVKVAYLQHQIEEAQFFRGADRERFADGMARTYAAVNEAHPFREGNGRVAREYMAQLAKESGHALDYTKVDRERWDEAAKQSARGNLQPVKEVFYEITVVERAVAFDRASDKASQRAALTAHPELDGAFKRLYIAERDGLDVTAIRREVSDALHKGHVEDHGVSAEESQRVIDRAASDRGLMVRPAAELGGTVKGEVVAVSSHHALLKVGDMVAVRYELSSLNRQIYPGEQLTISNRADQMLIHDSPTESQKPPLRNSMQFERERAFSGGA